MKEMFLNSRMWVILALGFSSGIPLALTASTLQAWMKSEDVDLTVIGVFSLVGLPYAIKFLWAPLMDRYVPPFLGRRRGWILLTQIALIAAVSAMAFSQPSQYPGVTAVLALLVAFCSASQDIVVDAFRADFLKTEELGPGAALHTTGYRVAMLCSGALSFILADHLPWKIVYLIMAASLGVGLVATFLAPEPVAPRHAPRTLKEAVVLPWVEFFRRKGAVEILGFILLYKLDVVMAVALTTPFMLEIGFSKTDIGAVTKGFGLGATIVGTLLGGAFITRLGIKKSLWTFGLLQGVSNLSFAALAHVGHSYPMMVFAIAAENGCSGMGNAAFQAFMMSICDKRFTATQYALLTSLMAVTRIFGQAPSGFFVKSLGWETYFIVCTLLAIPGLLILTRFSNWQKMQPEEAFA